MANSSQQPGAPYSISSTDLQDPKCARLNRLFDLVFSQIGITASFAKIGGKSVTVVPLAKLTSGGTNGSLSFNADGVLVSKVDPT